MFGVIELDLNALMSFTYANLSKTWLIMTKETLSEGMELLFPQVNFFF